MDGYSDLPKTKATSSSNSDGYGDLPKQQSFGEKYIQPVTDVANRALVGGTLGSVADIGNVPFQVIDWASEKLGHPTKLASEKPFLGSEYFGDKMQEAGFVTPTRRPVAEFITGIAPAFITGGVGLGKYGIAKTGELLDYLRGTKATEGLNTLGSAAKSEALAGKSAIESEATKTTQSEKSNVAALKDIEEAKYTSKEKLRTAVETAKKDANAALNDVSNKPITNEQFGSFVSEQGAKNVKDISAATEKAAIENIKDPAFERSRSRANAGDYPANHPDSAPILDKAIADVQQTIADTPEQFRGGLQQRLKTLFGEEVPLTEQELMVEQLRSSAIPGYVAQTTKQLPLTLNQMEFLRRWAKDPILRERTGFGALDDIRMKKLGDTIQQAMIAYEPDVGRYLKTYQTGKQAEELALGGQTGEAAIQPFGTKPQNIASTYLDGTKASAQKLVNLIGGKTSELVSNVRGKIRNDLQGLDATKTQKYLQDNSGLFEIFPELRAPVQKLSVDLANAEKLERMFSGNKGAGTRLSDALKTTQSAEKLVGKKSAEILGKGSTYQDLQIALEQLDTAKGQNIVTISRTIANTLRKEELIDANKHKQLLEYINNVGDNSVKAAELKKILNRIVLGGSVIGGADYTVRKTLGIQ